MKIAVCETKRTSRGLYLQECFVKGLMLHQEEVCDVSDYPDIPSVHSQDICYHTCSMNYTVIPEGTPDYVRSYGKYRPQDSVFRSKLFKELNHHEKPVIIAEQGYLFHGKSEQKDEDDYYVSLGVGGIKREAHYFNKNSPPDRWKSLQEKVGERRWCHPSLWREDGSHILIFGQNPSGVGTANMRKEGLSYEEWLRNTVKEIVRHTDRPILYRPHPTRKRRVGRSSAYTTPLIRDYPQFSQVSPFKPLSSAFDGCWCVVASASNASVEAIYHGVPVITSDPMSMVYDISSHDLSEIEYPKMLEENICQWFYDLAYAQWTHEEIRSGQAWSHIKEGIINENLLSIS